MVFDPFGTMTRGLYDAPRRPNPLTQAPTPEEETSVLGSLGSGALSALGTVGRVLDKTFGGRAIRSGILGQNPRELLSLIPGSDMLGITDPEDIKYGTDLIAPGVDAENRDWGQFLGGLGIDLATDPLTYLGGIGGLTKAGKLAQKAGVLQKGTKPGTAAARMQGTRGLQEAGLMTPAAQTSLEETARRLGQAVPRADEPLQSLFSIGGPFGFGPQLHVGTGAGAQRFATGVGELTDAFGRSGVGRGLKQLFKPAVKGLGTVEGQRGMQFTGTPAEQAALVSSRAELGQMDDLANTLGVGRTSKEGSARLRAALENPGSDAALEPLVGQMLRYGEQVTDVERQLGRRLMDAEEGAIEWLARSEAHPLEAVARHGMDSAQSQGRLRGLQAALGEAAQSAGTPGTDLVSLGDALKGLNIDKEAFIASSGLADNALIPRAVVDDFNRFNQMTKQGPKNAILAGYDGLLNMTKGMLTSLFPAFHARNAVTGMFQNANIGVIDPTRGLYNGIIRPYADAIAIKMGKPIKGLADDIPDYRGQGMDDAAATERIRREMLEQDTRVAREHTRFGDLVGDTRAGRMLPVEEGRFLTPQPKPDAPFWQRAFDSTSVAGARTTDDVWTPMRIGRDIGTGTDDAHRVAAFTELRRQGFTPEMASMRSKAAHYDYTQLTDFEKNVMRRVFPFYNWMRNNIPYVVSEAATKPSGLMGTTMRTMGRVRDAQQQDMLMNPDMPGVAVPGTGLQMMMTGMPWEDIMNPIQDVINMRAPFVSQTSPAIQLPIELATGRDLFTRRDIETPGQVLENVVGATPISRFVSTGRSLSRPWTRPTPGYEGSDIGAAAARLLGPVSLRATDPARERTRVIGRELEDALRLSGGPVRSMENFYVPPEQRHQLTPEQMSMMRYQNMLAQQRRQAAVERRGQLRPPLPVPPEVLLGI